ncbi:MAG: DinB family protein [Terriglobia bacterium]
MAFPEFPANLDARRAHLDEARVALLRELDAAIAGFSLARAPEPSPSGADAGLKAGSATDAWSVAETVYHLHLSEKSIARLLRKKLASADRHQPASVEQLRTEWERVERLVGRREVKVKAPALAEPTQAPSLEAGIELLGQSRQALLEVVRSVQYTDLMSVSAPHPFDAIGTLTGASWLSVVAFHEQRHTEQIQEIRRDGK